MANAEDAVVTVPKFNPSDVQTYTLSIAGRGDWKFRELTVDEVDAARDGAMTKGKDGTESFNGRTQMRLMITMSSVDPKLSLTDLAKLPQRVYGKIVDFVNDLNDEATLKELTEDDAGNS